MTDASTEEVPVRPLSAARVEAFSDGVMAIAITLLVIDIRLPEGEDDLLKQLLGLWPSYLAYLVSFATIGLIWLSHHAFFAAIRRVNGLLQAGNLLVLLCVAFLPFPTSVLAHHLEDGGWNARVATTFYFLTSAVQAGAWIVMGLAVRRDPTLLRPGCPAEFARTETVRGVAGFVGLAMIAAIGLVAPIAALVLYLITVVVGSALPVIAGPGRKMVRFARSFH